MYKFNKWLCEKFKNDYEMMYRFVSTIALSILFSALLIFLLFALYNNTLNRHTHIIHLDKVYNQGNIHYLKTDVLNSMNSGNSIDGKVYITECDGHYDMEISAFCSKYDYKKVILPIIKKLDKRSGKI